MLTSPILLDYQSSTPCLDEVVEVMKPYWTKNFANPSSKGNLPGLFASSALELAREQVERRLKLIDKKIIFTSGATESNNLAILGFARNFFKNSGKYGHIITLKTEHHAVLEPVRQLEKEGFSVTEINPGKDGLISEETFLKALKDNTFLVSIMYANNEIGVVQPIEDIFKICQTKKIILHTDAAQCLGYLPIKNFNSIANMITISSHKIYGPKGVGLLILDKDIEICPLQYGGGQEFGYRSGTIPLPLIVGFSKAIELSIKNQISNAVQLLDNRNILMNGLLERNDQLLINGSITKRLPHNLNVTILNKRGSQIHKYLKSRIICSTGSACSNGRPSHVLQAIGRSFKESESSLRLSIGLMTTTDEVERAISIITKSIRNVC